MRSIMVYALLAVCGLSGAPAQGPGAVGANLPVEAEHLFAQANQARMEAGAPPLHWDAALAAAALAHCRLMVAAVQIGHRYQGEPDLAERAGAAGAHFGLIEENVAAAPSAAEVHNSWMHSPGHRKNLLNPEVDRVGIVVIASRGELYAVADYTRAVPLLVTSEVEARVARLIAAAGMHAAGDSTEAREACAAGHGLPKGTPGAEPGFVMRWQGDDLSQLPEPLIEKMASGRYHRAVVANCPAHGEQGAFTVYRVAVLLY